MRLLSLPLLLAALFQVQGAKAKEIEDLKKRVVLEKSEKDGAPQVKVTGDGTLLYSGPGKNARVEIESPARLPGQLFVSVRVEGEEVARFWVKSLSKPVKFPPTTVLDPENMSHASTSQGNQEKTTCSVTLTDAGGAKSLVYEGPGADIEPRVVGKAPKRWYSIRVDGEIVYFAPVLAEATAQKAKEGLPLGKPAEPPAPQVAPVEETRAESIAAILKRLNEFRVSAGIPSVKEDPRLSEGCQLHAEYLQQNPREEGPKAHTEDSNLPGYSEAGLKSAARSVISRTSHVDTASKRVDSLVATLYHRLPLLHPKLSVIGIGVSRFAGKGKVVVIDCDSVDESIPESVRPVVFPGIDQEQLPTQFALGGTERPNPCPEPGSPAGYPITVSFAQSGWSPFESIGSLRASDTEIPCWIFCRENQALQDHPLPDVVCLLPKKPLLPNTKYTASVKCKKLGIEGTPTWSITWSFTTGNAERTTKE